MTWPAKCAVSRAKQHPVTLRKSGGKPPIYGDDHEREAKLSWLRRFNRTFRTLRVSLCRRCTGSAGAYRGGIDGARASSAAADSLRADSVKVNRATANSVGARGMRADRGPAFPGKEDLTCALAVCDLPAGKSEAHRDLHHALCPDRKNDLWLFRPSWPSRTSCSPGSRM